MHCVRLQLAFCAAALLAMSGFVELVAQVPQTRTISLHNIHTEDTVTVEYKRNGRYVPEAMEKLNWVMRDWRRNETTRMDPELIDLLWEMHTELGSKEPINLISAFRSRNTNETLRRAGGGQASESRHILGKAADVQFPDVPVKQLRYSAMVRERGGVGYYPTSGTPFVHVDTDRVRAWPRLPRYELALLFPNGHTQHLPADGGPITLDDVKTARARNKDVALQLAAFHDMRRGIRQSTTQVADARLTRPVATPPTPAKSASPSPFVASLTSTIPFSIKTPVVETTALDNPRLVAAPRPVERPSRLMQRPSDDDRQKLTQLILLSAIPQPQIVVPPHPAVRPPPASNATPRQSSRGGEAPLDLVDSEQIDAVEANPRLMFVADVGVESMTGWSNGWAAAPAFDDDHPEEGSYRPFPLASVLSASVDDPAKVQLVHPDFAMTGDLIDYAGTAPQIKLRSGRRIAHVIWAGDADADSSLATLGAQARSAAMRSEGDRRVRTTVAR